MPSWQDTIIISSAVTKQFFGQDVTVYDAPQPVAVWPQQNSGGPRATVVMLYGGVDFRLSFDAVCNTEGPYSAYFIKNLEYVVPLHPNVMTVYMMDAQSTSGVVRMKWIDGR